MSSNCVDKKSQEIDYKEKINELLSGGVTSIFASLVDSAGVIRGKSVPVERLASLCRSGVGASPSWALFCADNAIAWIPEFSAVGDHRLRADVRGLVSLKDGFCWAPVDVCQQNGEPADWCSRTFLRQQEDVFRQLGIDVLVAGELEFFLIADDKSSSGNQWHAYGMGELLNREQFVNDVTRSFAEAGLGLEQFHAEYGTQQFELSLSPATPVRATDKLSLARILLGRIARRHGCRVSFSPQPYADNAGNGAHIHFSFTRNGIPLLSAGEGQTGMRPEGESVIAGIIAWLPQLIALLAPSAISANRLQPGHWSGAYACWGLENREAAVRFCAANASNPYGAHLEVKCIDPSANPYIACGAVLAMAAAGISQLLPIPQEVTIAPDDMSEQELETRNICRLIYSQNDALQKLEESEFARSVINHELLAALIAVRRHENTTYSHLSDEERAEKLRFRWSV